jgi:hypothetical protein
VTSSSVTSNVPHRLTHEIPVCDDMRFIVSPWSVDGHSEVLAPDRFLSAKIDSSKEPLDKGWLDFSDLGCPGFLPEELSQSAC